MSEIISAKTLSDLNATSRDAFDPALKESIWKYSAWRYDLYMKKKLTEGPLKEVLVRKQGTNAVAYGTTESIDVKTYRTQDTLRKAYFHPAVQRATAFITDTDLARNKGNIQLVDLQKERNDDMVEQFNQFLATELAGSYVTDGKIWGIGAAISASNTYAGIDRTTTDYTMWKSQVDSTTTLSTLEWSKLRKLRGECEAYGMNNPNLRVDRIVTTRTIWEKLVAIADSTVQRMPINGYKADLGVNVVIWEGIEIMWDPYIAANQLYMYGSNNLVLNFWSDMNMSITPWHEVDTVYGVGKEVSNMCQLVLRSPINCGVMTALA